MPANPDDFAAVSDLLGRHLEEVRAITTYRGWRNGREVDVRIHDAGDSSSTPRWLVIAQTGGETFIGNAENELRHAIGNVHWQDVDRVASQTAAGGIPDVSGLNIDPAATITRYVHEAIAKGENSTVALVIAVGLLEAKLRDVPPPRSKP